MGQHNGWALIASAAFFAALQSGANICFRQDKQRHRLYGSPRAVAKGEQVGWAGWAEGVVGWAAWEAAMGRLCCQAAQGAVAAAAAPLQAPPAAAPQRVALPSTC